MKIKHVFFIITIFLLSACSSNNTAERLIKSKDTNAFNILIHQYSNNIEQIWGANEILIAGPKDYVQYSDDFQTRVHINFVSGQLAIETISEDPFEQLKPAIIATLLMSEPSDTIQSNQIFDVKKEPFLYKQVVDESNQAIRYEWRANHFADYLLKHEMKIRFSNAKQISYININLVANHVNERARKFLPFIHTASKRYQLDEKLILSIIEVESNFNPFAVSKSNALGLMQVQQYTSGRDLYHRLGKSGDPTRSYLLDPSNNINMGSAYLALIRDNYLAGVENPISMKYLMICSYNGGAGNTLRTFSNDRKKAVNVINKLTPDQIYEKLILSHLSEESRRYLIKVNKILTKS